MLCACIDIGSNTTRVLVADVRGGAVEEVLARRSFTRVGRDLRDGGRLSEAKIAEVAEVVAEQRALAEGAGAEALRTVATAAIRAASNGDELVRAVERRAGVRVSVLDGVEEARLAFLGATRTLPRPPAGAVTVVDVGGGSTEIAVGSLVDGVTWSASFRVGSGTLADAHLRSDPPTRAEIESMRGEAAGAFEGLQVPVSDRAVAVGGSAASLRRLVGEQVGRDAVARGLGVLSGSPSADVARRFSLDPERVRLLPAGLVLLAECAGLLGRPLEIGCGGLREGVCLELAG